MSAEQAKQMSQEQRIAEAVLRALTFEPERTMPGAPMRFNITSKVIDSLKSQEGKAVVVPAGGTVTIE
jgi:hypothetical protein